MKLFIFSMALMFVSCTQSFLIDENCILTPVVNGNEVYHVGPCMDNEGKVSSVKFRWQNFEGEELRATVDKNKVVTLEYFSQIDPLLAGIWIKWDSKAGVMLGSVPPEIAPIVYNKPEDDTEKLLDWLNE